MSPQLPDSRHLTVKVRALGASGETAPRVVDYRLEVLGCLPGEAVELTLAFYDGADPAGEPVPGRYQVQDYGMGRAQAEHPPALELSVSLPTEYSGWAVREVRAAGWAWPFVVDSGAPPAPGSTPAGAPVPQDERFLAREPATAPEPGTDSRKGA